MTLLRKIRIEGIDEEGNLTEVAVTVNNELEVRDAYSYKTLSKIEELTDSINELMLLYKEGLVNDDIVSVLKNLTPFHMRYINITTATTTLCKEGNGFFSKIIINNPTNQRISIYDSIIGSGPLIASIDPDVSTTPIELNYGLEFHYGLTIVTDGTPDITIIYK